MAKNILVVLLTILLVIGLVYFVCVSVFGWPMLTKMQMFILMLLINLLSPFHYTGDKS